MQKNECQPATREALPSTLNRQGARGIPSNLKILKTFKHNRHDPSLARTAIAAYQGREPYNWAPSLSSVGSFILKNRERLLVLLRQARATLQSITRWPSAHRSNQSDKTSQDVQEDGFYHQVSETETTGKHWRSLRNPNVIWEFLEGDSGRGVGTGRLGLGEPCLVICGELHCGRRLARHFTSRGDEAHIVTDVHEALRALEGQPRAWSVSILDVDSVKGVMELSETLIRFRAEVPEAPLLMISSGFTRDDFSQSRLAICDASIRNPASSFSIAKGVKAAIENNTSWRSRCTTNRPLQEAADDAPISKYYLANVPRSSALTSA